MADRVAHVRKDDFALIIECDAATTEMTGWSAEEMVGKRSMEFLHPADRQRAVEGWVHMLEEPEQGVQFRYRHRCKDGSYLWVDVTNHNLLESSGYVLAEMVEAAGDVAATDEGGTLDDALDGGSATMIARVMRDQEWLLRRLAESLPTGVALADAEGVIVYANRRLHDLLGSEAARTINELFARALDEDKPIVAAAVEAALRRSHDTDLELHLRARDGSFPSLCVVNIRAVSDQPGAMGGAMVCVADVTESARLKAELERRATIDTLTGCQNRASTVEFLTDVLAGGLPVAAVFIDVNGLKSVNDRLGHAAGDELIAGVASRLIRSARTGDVTGRIGGDEFLLVCPNVADPTAAFSIACRTAHALEGPLQVSGSTLRPSASIGVAHTRTGGTTPDELIASADTAMYQAKRQRGTVPVLFEPREASDTDCA